MKESRYNIWVSRDGAHFVYNGMSGALLRLSPDDYQHLQEFLSGKTEADCRPQLLSDLIVGRMVINDGTDELAMLESTYRASRLNPDTLSLTLVTSLGCNFDCPYCFEAKHPSIMSQEVEAALLELLDDRAPEIKRLNVTWFGGEPLVGKQSLLRLSDAFIERCDRRSIGYSARITTNGYLLDEEICVALRDRRVSGVQISLDGPPEVHDRMRPLADGRGTFWKIIENLHHAVKYFGVSLRINVDKENLDLAEELLRILERENFAGKLQPYLGQLVSSGAGDAPSKSSGHCFLTNREFALAEHKFNELAFRYGFGSNRLPKPVGAPCTAVRQNELVVGSNGELYKCYLSIGDKLEVIGDIRNFREQNGRAQKWLLYDPFSNSECRQCMALPVCMGGCAHHAMDPIQYENRCGTFRHNHEERVARFVDIAETRSSKGLISSHQLSQPTTC